MNNLSSTPNKVPTILFGIACLTLAVWLYAKFILFDTAAYTSDLFLHLQLTLGWLEGKPFLYENSFGDHSKIHNYYFSPLLAPFTYIFGAYGLFIAQFLLYIGAVAALIISSRHAYSRQSKHLLYFSLFVFLLGPLAFRIWDNPQYGFHAEMLYVPLSILFILALEFRRVYLSILTAALIVLVKEDGAVLGACIHLSWLVMRHFHAVKSDRIKLARKTLPWLALWLIIFTAGALLLSFKNDFQSSRIGEVLDKTEAMDNGALTGYFQAVITDFILLLLPLIIFITLYFRLRNILIFLLFISPIIVVEIVSGLYYYPVTSFSIIWNPRMAVIWAFAGSFLVMTCFRRDSFSDFIAFKYSLIGMLLFGVVLYYLQAMTLRTVTDYAYMGRIFPAKKLHYPDEQAKLEVAQCIAKQLPRNTNIAPPHKYFGAFPYQTIVWYDHMDNAYKLPEVVLVDVSNTAIEGHDFLKGYKSDSMGLFKVYTKPDIRLRACPIDN